ncbi:hypothetical protein COP2_010163 [Malus domestica]
MSQKKVKGIYKQAKGNTSKTKAKWQENRRAYDRKAKHLDYAQFRCNMTAFNTIVQEVKSILNSKQINLIKKTPFWPVIKTFYEGRMSKDDIVKSNLDLNEMVKVFNHQTKSFNFGKQSIKITSKSVTKVLGLPNEAKMPKMMGPRYNSTFRQRYFGKWKISKVRLDNAFRKAIAWATNPPQQNSNQAKGKGKGKGMSEEEFEVVDYDKDVLINTSLVEHAKAKETENKPMGPIGGCIIILPFLFCERTTLIQPMIGKENSTPIMTKWILQEMHTKFKQLGNVQNIEPFFKAQSEIDDCDDVEDYDYGNHDDVRDENFASVTNKDGEEDEDDENEKSDEDEGSKDENVNRRTKIMEEHVEMMNKKIKDLEDINVALQVENGMFKLENEKLKKRIKELEAKIIEEQLGTSKDNTNNQMLEKYQEDHPVTSMDIAAEFANPMDVSTRQNEANVQENASITPEGPEVDAVQKRVRKKRKLSCYKYNTTNKKRKKQDDDLPSYNQEINVESSMEAAKDNGGKLELLERANKKSKMKVQFSKLKWGKSLVWNMLTPKEKEVIRDYLLNSDKE